MLRRQRLQMQTFLEFRSFAETAWAVFRVPTSTFGDVFMRVDQLNHNLGRSAVVEVDAARFLGLWQQPHSAAHEIAQASPATWPEQLGYGWEEDTFGHGRCNPVPLAQVWCGYARRPIMAMRRKLLFWREQVMLARAGEPYLGFTEGVARTTWLLAQRAPVFPVHCPLGNAQMLQDLVGVEGGRPIPLAELMSEMGLTGLW